MASLVFISYCPLSGQQLNPNNNTEYIVQDSVLIPTRDHAIITAIIARKKSDTALPAILTFTIYPGPLLRSTAMTFAARDYVGVVATTRGKRLSPQEVEPFEHDAEDAYDIIEWISKQTWCNGKVGMYGGSYNGFSTWAATKNIHPALKTIIPIAAAAPGYDMPKFNGVFRNFFALPWMRQVTNSKLDDLTETNNEKKWDSVFNTWYYEGRSYRSIDTIDGRPNKIYHRWLDHPAYDRYWSNMIPQKEQFAKINIPVLTITGYYDGEQAGALYYFYEHYKYHGNPDHYLLIGPFDHQGVQGMAKRIVDRYLIDSVARIIFFPVIVTQWFDHILKNGPRPPLIQKKFNYQVMGTNRWYHADRIQDISNDTLTFYFSDTHTGQHYQLSHSAPKMKDKYVKVIVDFKKRRSQQKNWNIIDSNFNQYQYLSFISEPFPESTRVSGSFIADLSVIINKKDLDIEMEMFELMPNGKYFLLSTEFMSRASLAKDGSTRKLLEPGKRADIPVRNTFFTSKQLSKGSRLVFLLGVPVRYDRQINYGSGKDVSDETLDDAKIPLEVKWLISSRIKVPIFR